MKQIIEYCQSFLVMVLVVSGIGGVSFYSFKEDGWIENWLGDIWELHVQYPLIAVPVTVSAMVLGKMWHDEQLATGRLTRVPEFVITALMAAGTYFIGYYAIYGSL